MRMTVRTVKASLVQDDVVTVKVFYFDLLSNVSLLSIAV